VQGIVVARQRRPGYTGRIRPLKALVDDQPVLDPELWQLVQWLSRYYLTPLGQVARTVLPAGLSTRYRPPTRWLVRLEDDHPDPALLSDRAPTQARVVAYLKQQAGAVPVIALGYLAASPLTVCRRLVEKGYVRLWEEVRLPDVTGFTFAPIHKEIAFSASQQTVLRDLAAGLEKGEFQPYLLHGVTGSGKTEIYIEMARQVLDRGRTVILLLPEIALTPQIAGRFRAVFGDSVALWHSKLSRAARAWTWKQICAGEFQVVIGARSAVFAPLKRLGLIVVDEEQEHSYKQESPAPRYHARDVALMRGKLHRAVVVLASATPSLESYYNQNQGKLTYLRLPERFGGARYPRVHVVDMERELEESGKAGQVFSSLLLEKIEDRLTKGEQVILLQNRRGYAPILRCGDCGEVEMCPHCQVSLTYHRAGNLLRCHFCDYTRREQPQQCRACASPNLRLFGTGTQKVEDQLQATFPQARMARLDLDAVRTGTALTRVLERFARREIDILLGTQMIAKGLDFEHATLVGIINADLGLYLPDFRSGERVFQLVYQAAGRAGRRRLPGEVVVQTYNPENPVIKYATRLDLKTYYNIALSERQELNYAPFSWMVKMELSGRRKSQVEHRAQALRQRLPRPYRGLEILGPAFCYRERLGGRYRMQIVLKSRKKEDPNGTRLHRYLEQHLQPELDRGDRGGVKLILDVDPVSLL
jgi:primosomal protein N' (replication factor Y)